MSFEEGMFRSMFNAGACRISDSELHNLDFMASPETPQTAELGPGSKTTILKAQNAVDPFGSPVEWSSSPPDTPTTQTSLTGTIHKLTINTDTIGSLSPSHQVIFVPELLEIILYYTPPFQVLTTIRQVHPFFDRVVQTSPLLSWQTWTSSGTSPPGLPTYAVSPVILKPRAFSPHYATLDPPLEVCSMLHPIISKWWARLVQNTNNYNVFPLRACVYSRIFPTGKLDSIYLTRPPIPIDDLSITFSSTYSFVVYGQNCNVADLEKPKQEQYPIDEPVPSRLVTIEGLLRRMWIPVTEHLGHWQARPSFRRNLEHDPRQRTLTMIIRLRERGSRMADLKAAEVILDPIEPYDVRVDQYL